MRAAGLVGTAVLVSRLVGLVREIVIKDRLGLDLEALAYEAANTFPENIFLIIAGGAIGSAFIPTFANYFENEDEAGAWRLFSAIINLLTLTTTAIAGIVFIFAEPFTRFFLSSQVTANPDILPLTVQLMRIMLLTPIIFGISGVFMATLNARQHFLLPAIAPILYNLGIIAGALAFERTELGLALGTVAGACVHLLIQIPGLWQKGATYTPIFTIRDKGVQQVLKLMAPRVLGLSFSSVNRFITLYLSGFLAAASFPALNGAFRLMILPQGFLGQALGIAAFPTMSSLVARGALDEMKGILVSSLRLLLFLGLPATMLLGVLRVPIITILWERGAFGANDTQLVAWALLFYSFSLLPLISLEVIARAFYALSDTWTPVLAGGAQIVLMGLLSVWFSGTLFPSLGWLPLGGVALGFSISNILEIILLLWLLDKKVGGMAKRPLLTALLQTSLAAFIGGVLTWGCLQLVANVWGQLIIGSLVGGVAYLTICGLLQLPELTQFIRLIRRRLPARWQ